MLYKEASQILETVLSKKGSTKNLVFNSKYKNKKQLYALVCETLKYKAVLMEIIEVTNIQRHEKFLRQQSLALVLVYDHLIGKGQQGPSNKFQEAVLRHKASLAAQLERIKVRGKVSTVRELIEDSCKNEVAIPRYVRVNTLKMTVEDAVKQFCNEGYVELSNCGMNYESYISALKDMKPQQFIRDLHVPDLLTFTSGTDLHDHPLYTTGCIIFQDKASCLPAFVLDPAEESHVIDCCAAPGNKTSQLCALLNNTGKVFAFDKDSQRAATLRKMLSKARCLNSNVTHTDFLKVDPHDQKYQRVEYILVDPSCSGSGIVSRQKEDIEDLDEEKKSRLEGLAHFQVKILSHALKFPNVKKLVYSTCSVHKEENESVVHRVLQTVHKTFQLSSVMKDFPGRGQNIQVSAFKAQNCLRLNPGADLTTGFFVACFKRKDVLQNSDGIELMCTNVTGKKSKRSHSVKGEEGSVSVSDGKQVDFPVKLVVPRSSKKKSKNRRHKLKPVTA